MKHYLSLLFLSLTFCFEFCLRVMAFFVPVVSVADYKALPKRPHTGVPSVASDAVNFARSNPARISGAFINRNLAGLRFA